MSDPLRAVILSPDTALAGELNDALAGFEDLIRVVAKVPGYPSNVELARLLRHHKPDAVFLGFERTDSALAFIQSLDAEAQGLPVIGFDRAVNSQVLRESMRAGARDFLCPPFGAGVLRQSLSNLRELVQKEPPSFGATDRIYSFLPSKPGVGTTTLALNVTATLARRTGSRALLADLDLSCGMLRFLLKLGGEYSVVDAASHASHLDDELWPQLMGSCGNVHVLDSGSLNPQARIEPEDLQALVDFARRRYEAICFDHSGNLERYSLEALEESRRIFLVCTPEVASLQLARERLDILAAKRLTPRVGLLLNRVNQALAVTVDQVEQVLGIRIAGTFRNDYRAVERSVEAGSWIPEGSPLGRQFDRFADTLLAVGP